METFDLIERESVSLLDRARELVVKSDEQYYETGEFIMICKQMIAKIQGAFKEPKQKAFEAHRSITQLEKNILQPVEQAMKVAGQVALDYKREQDRLAKEEADRIAREKQRQEEERRLAEAVELESKGDVQAAEQVLSAPVQVPRQVKFMTPVPKVHGLSTTKTWKGRIVQPHDVKREYCLPDQQLVNYKIKSFFAYVKDPTPEQIKALEADIGGVEVYQDEVFAGRVRA